MATLCTREILSFRGSKAPGCFRDDPRSDCARGGTFRSSGFAWWPNVSDRQHSSGPRSPAARGFIVFL